MENFVIKKQDDIKPAHPAYRLTYACDANGVLWNIDEVPNGNACRCFCPACGEPLMARNHGSVRIHHFAHQSGTECKYACESMLHLLAKAMVQDAFYSDRPFLLKFEHRSYCPNEKNCQLERYSECCTRKTMEFDLKKYYDTCEQETPYDKTRRRSDLKISSSTHPGRKPIYIEFCVTHASDAEKLHSGDRIIEIKLESEQDVARLVEHGFRESKTYKDAPYAVDSPNVALYGFEKKVDYENYSMGREIEFVRYTLYPSGKMHFHQGSCVCCNLKKSSHSSLLEIVYHASIPDGIYEYAKYIGFSKYQIRNCMVCKNYVDNYNGRGKLCSYYKQLQIDRTEKLDTSRAKSCPHFSVDQEEKKKLLLIDSDIPQVVFERKD